MEKKELISLLQNSIKSGEITQEEIQNTLMSEDKNIIAQASQPEDRKPISFLTRLLYIIGASVVIIGIVFFIAQIWGDLNSVLRIFITLGLGFVFAACGSYFMSRPEIDLRLGNIFHIIGGVVIPIGIVVTLSEYRLMNNSMWPVATSFGIMFLFYFLLTWYHKKVVLTFFSIANATAFVYLSILALVVDNNSFITYLTTVYAYTGMVIGLSYLALAHGFQNTWNQKIVFILNALGSFIFLSSAFSRVAWNSIWEIIFVAFPILGMILAIHNKSRSILISSTFFMVVYFIYITVRYFSDSIGWPISLVLIGFILIGLGFLSISLNKKYISQTQ